MNPLHHLIEATTGLYQDSICCRKCCRITKYYPTIRTFCNYRPQFSSWLSHIQWNLSIEDTMCPTGCPI